MTLIALKCSHCHSELVGKHGIDNGKQRYICKNPDCPHTTFYTEYTYNTCKPGVKEAVRKQAVNGSGVRAISRCLGISTDTVIAELKKRRSGHKQRQQRILPKPLTRENPHRNGRDAELLAMFIRMAIMRITKELIRTYWLLRKRTPRI